MPPDLPTRHRGILSAAAAERRRAPHLAGCEVTYEIHPRSATMAINVYFEDHRLGDFIVIGEDGIVPIEEEGDAS